MRLWAGRIGGTLVTITLVNFAAFLVHTSKIGGSTANGKRVEGRYYVGEHGRYTEVTERRWQAMRAHEVSVFMTHTLGALLGGALLTYAGRGGRQPQTPAEPGAAHRRAGPDDK
ncbi:hypothetical protein R5W23_005651 [Gemmata sp. JC673]|uniref:DUF3592 domain-containing protein n=1 Tax=Gemmata algarum TaxID=2975278 RepID=A0ABU5ET68_9BACT|nr:hypothetical protein [Gemmata algarum]MDY3558531.1 hypothetical protein [Gemmata algarum]